MVRIAIMPTYDECKVLGRQVVIALVDAATGTPRQRRVLGLHQDLLRLGFRLREIKVFGLQPDGRQLLYTMHDLQDEHDRTILVRVKTRGNDRPPREGVPHMAVSLVQGGLEWKNERAKFNSTGQIASKMTTDGVKPPPPTGHSFPTLIDPNLTPAGQDAWADRCHFNFVAGFDITGATTLIAEPAAS
jgi:hypothetical protein